MLFFKKGGVTNPNSENKRLFSIKHLEAIPLNIPFYCESVSQHMPRALTHGEQVYVYRVELSNGVVGYGENLDATGTTPASSSPESGCGAEYQRPPQYTPNHL